MKESKNPSVYYVLILCEIATSIGLGVFGNWLADLIHISPTGVLVGSLFMILFFFFITVQRIRYEQGKETIFSASSNYQFAGFVKDILKRDITVFPAALILGILIGFTSIVLFPKRDFFILQTRWFGQYRYFTWNDYEIFSYLIVVITVYFVNRYTKDAVLVFMFSIAYTVGLLGTFLLYRPEQNDIINIVLNFLAIMILTALVRSKAVEVFLNDVRSLWSNLMPR